MKVLVITPIYYIKGREKLFHDTSAIHYLLKYWPKNAEIVVVHEYHSSIKQFGRYVKKQERNYLKFGYHFEEDGIKVHMYELPIFPRQKTLLKSQQNYMIKHINRILKKDSFNPDIIISHQPSYYSSQYIDKIVSDAKRIAVLHYSDVKEQKRDKNYIQKLYSNYDNVFCRSNSIYKFFENEGLENLSKQYIYSGIPNILTTIEKHWDSNCIQILYVGKLIKRKNVDLIIRALSKIKNSKDFRLIIIGQGPEKKNLIELSKKLSLSNKVKFIPHISREEVYSYMGKSDIFIMPSIGETMGLVYLEAMQQGCITIGTKGEGIDGIIKNGKNGFLVEPNSVDDLVKILKTIFNNSSYSNKKISYEAQKISKGFKEESMGKEYFNIIKGCM